VYDLYLKKKKDFLVTCKQKIGARGHQAGFVHWDLVESIGHACRSCKSSALIMRILLCKVYNYNMELIKVLGGMWHEVTYPSKAHPTTHRSLPHFIARNNVLPSIACNKIKVIKGVKEIHAIITDMAINSSL